MPASGAVNPVFTHRRQEQSRWALLIAPVAITLAGAALRLAGLGLQSFDEDEAATVALMHRSFWSMLDHIGPSESTPPLYYILAWPWTHLLGSGEAQIRSLSALFGSLTIAAAYALGAALGGRRAGLVAAALTAASPMLVWYSQEARAYALVTLLATIATVYFVRGLRDPSPSNLARWGIAAALALASHYFAGFLIAAEIAALLWCSRERVRVACASALPVATALALVPLVLAQRADPLKTSYIQMSALGARVTGIGKEFLLGPNVPLGRWAGVIVVLAFLLAGWLLTRRAPDRKRVPAAIVALAAAAALAVPVLLAVIKPSSDFVVARNMLPMLVPLLAVAAVGFTAATRALAAAGLVVLLGLAATVAVQLDASLQRPDWRQATRALGTIATAPRAILVAPAYRGVAPMFVYLKEPSIPPPDLRACVREVDVISLPANGQRRPARLALEPPAPGFRLIARESKASFSLLRFAGPTVLVSAISVGTPTRILLQRATPPRAAGACT